MKQQKSNREKKKNPRIVGGLKERRIEEDGRLSQAITLESSGEKLN